MNRFSIVLFTAALAVTHFLQAQNPLPVALESQEASQWCWAASGAMIMKYRGRSVSQCEQACRRLHLKDCCQRRTGDCNKSGWPQFKAYGFTCKTTSDRELSEKQIEDQINNRKPVAFSWHLLDETGRDEGRGHMMVIIGYKILNGDLQLRVNNPLPMSEGSQSWMSYEDYVAVDNDHRHWNDYYDVQ